MKYKHYIFDIDGTLIDTAYAIICSLQEILKQNYHKEYSWGELQFCLGITSEDTVKRLGLKVDEDFYLLWNRKMEELLGTVKVFDGITEVLTKLKENSAKLGIITSENREEYHIYFLPYKIDGYFDYVVIADDTKNHKPHEEPIMKYREMAGITLKDMIYIGDSPYDMKCAKNAGIDCALALWNGKSPEGIEADYYLKSPYEILNL